MNKEDLIARLNAKLAEKLASMGIPMNENHYSEDDLERILDTFEKDMNHEGIQAVEAYMSAEADGNKGAASKAAARIKKALGK